VTDECEGGLRKRDGDGWWWWCYRVCVFDGEGGRKEGFVVVGGLKSNDRCSQILGAEEKPASNQPAQPGQKTHSQEIQGCDGKSLSSEFPKK
jgi:hypothetical protein